jgi:hypothetical protein
MSIVVGARACKSDRAQSTFPGSDHHARAALDSLERREGSQQTVEEWECDEGLRGGSVALPSPTFHHAKTIGFRVRTHLRHCSRASSRTFHNSIIAHSIQQMTAGAHHQKLMKFAPT